MSSNIYQDKALEEIRPIVENFVNKYKAEFGANADVMQVIEKLRDLRASKEKKLFESIFSHLTPKNLDDCVKIIEEQYTSIKSKDYGEGSIKVNNLNESDYQLKKKTKK